MSAFFFSSRRRHTRYIGDWSSDVCSSDLIRICKRVRLSLVMLSRLHMRMQRESLRHSSVQVLGNYLRSEERRVGKECRLRLTPSAERYTMMSAESASYIASHYYCVDANPN